MQLVLCNNRILTYGENFISLGGVVINTETGKKYENATIAECDCIPSDINDVGYEYHAGNFVPCAPYGKGTRAGNVPVVCNEDCKAIKDTGIPFSQLGEVFEIECTNLSGGIKIAYNFEKLPKIMFISGGNGKGESGIVFPASGIGFVTSNDTVSVQNVPIHFAVSVNKTTTGYEMFSNTWSPSGSYKVIAIC